jgi:hypothetical protein
MAQDALLAVLGKAALDPAFLKQLKADPEAAAQAAGVNLTRAQIKQLKKVNFAGLADFGKQVEAKKLSATVDKKDS